MIAAGCIAAVLLGAASSCTTQPTPHEKTTTHGPSNHRPFRTDGMSADKSASSASPAPTTTATRRAASPCTRHSLVVHQVSGQGVNSAEDLLDFQVANIGAHSCLVHRYPNVRFRAATRRVVPFQILRTTPPAIERSRLLLRPHKSATFGLAVSRCLVRPSALATEVTVQIPGLRRRYRLTVKDVTLRSTGLPYCGAACRPDTVGVLPMYGR